MAGIDRTLARIEGYGGSLPEREPTDGNGGNHGSDDPYSSGDEDYDDSDDEAAVDEDNDGEAEESEGSSKQQVNDIVQHVDDWIVPQ